MLAAHTVSPALGVSLVDKFAIEMSERFCSFLCHTVMSHRDNLADAIIASVPLEDSITALVNPGLLSRITTLINAASHLLPVWSNWSSQK